MAFPKTCTQCGSEDLRIPGDSEEDQNIYCNSCNAVVGDKKKLAKEIEDEGEGDHQVEKLLKSLSGKE
ncbi:hypothetical protein B0H98_102103 [Vreelandella songnenensis]|uniref:Uncharacterized protein n=1 Tax=Vreelandella songnenensis TaxID=1176243 RepID=A0A2T0V5X4_9GAMM|nr:hypothetical protein [Halomonas songnenensis]PRY65579.1 hypothetical protein B0H98_102103 [Halomonas songnenensis]